MDKNIAIKKLVAQHKAKLVAVSFGGRSSKTYTYATSIMDIRIGDVVVVEAGESYQVVTVANANMPPMFDDAIKYRWVVDRVDFTDFSRVLNECSCIEENKINES